MRVYVFVCNYLQKITRDKITGFVFCREQEIKCNVSLYARIRLPENFNSIFTR